MGSVAMVAICLHGVERPPLKGPRRGTRKGGTQEQGRILEERGDMEGSRMMSVLVYVDMSGCLPYHVDVVVVDLGNGWGVIGF